MSNVVFSNVHLNFSFDSDSLFSRIETILYQWAKKDLSDVFDKVFEDRDVDDADLHLENVDFDLGDVPEGFFLSETCSRLKEKLEQLLYPKIENQRKTICLKILLNSCKKFAPEIEASQVEEIFSIVYRAEDSKETIFKNVISILQKNHPDLSFDEMTQDVLNELIFVKSKKDNIYLLNVLEKIYFSFFQEQEESFIQSFLTSTIPQHYSDGYLDLLKHFILEMQEKYPELSDIQNSKNLFFEALKDNNNADLKQIFSNICASVLPGNSSTFIDDFIAKTKESVPAITTLGIVILFIDELKQKYPHLNDFRLSNFNEDKLSDLSKIYWKEDIKEILWDIYKSILQPETSSSENASESIDVQTVAQDTTQNNAENKAAETNEPEIDATESETIESKTDSNKNSLEEPSDSEKSTLEDDKQNLEKASVSDKVQKNTEQKKAQHKAENKADDFNDEKIEIADSNNFETKTPEANTTDREVLESESDSNKNPLAEPSDSEKSTIEDKKQILENESVSDEAQNKTQNKAQRIAENKAEESNDEKIEIVESNTTETNAVEASTTDREVLESESDSNKNLLAEPSDSEKSTLEDGKQNLEKASVSDKVQNKTQNKAQRKAENKTEDPIAEKSESKPSPFESNTTQIQTSEKFDKIFNECFAEDSSSNRKPSPLQITESFISKLQKEFPDQAVFNNVVKAYQKATELEMKYNSAVDTNTKILVKDAGLVLIGAYVPMLFKKLEYIADGAFISEQTRLKACSLLRYIVFGDLPSDGLHFLGNYFCGLPWNFRIPKEIKLDENEKNIAESLIKSVIENWKAIGHVSIDGFRGTFLHREGTIEKEGDEEIYLKVKEGPFDMLLDKLPWSYSMLKFKWNKKLLSTTWR